MLNVKPEGQLGLGARLLSDDGWTGPRDLMVLSAEICLLIRAWAWVGGPRLSARRRLWAG